MESAKNRIVPTCQMTVRMLNTDRGDWELITVEVPGRPGPGPRDQYLKVDGYFVRPDKDGNYIGKNYTEPAVDAIHSFAVARLTIDFWENLIGQKVRWYWSNSFYNAKLHIDLFDPMTSAMYHREDKAIIFGTYGRNRMRTCRSFDMVAHETSHAILDGLIRHSKMTIGKEGMAVIEALCDIIPMLLICSIPQFSPKSILISDTNLSLPNAISEFAIGYGPDGISGIRSALNVKQHSKNSCDQGSIITYVLYDMIDQIAQRSVTIEEFQQLIEHLSRHTISSFLSLQKITLQDYLLEIKSYSIWS